MPPISEQPFPAGSQSPRRESAQTQPRLADLPASFRLIETERIRLSEIMAAFSVGLDLALGQAQGHSMRTCLIGMRLAQELGLGDAERSDLFYALLLKDLGCTANASKLAWMLGADDAGPKQRLRVIDWSNPNQSLRECWKESRPGARVFDRFVRDGAILRYGREGGVHLSKVRCERGAELARRLSLSEATAEAILHLDERWNGDGLPRGLRGEEISLLGRIGSLAQTVETFASTSGLPSAFDVARDRRQKWFDPQLVDALLSCRNDEAFWSRLRDADVPDVSGREPEGVIRWTDAASLDRIAEVFAFVVDAKSPWTTEHSSRVGEIAAGMAETLGCGPELVIDVRRAGLLHDIGKLGVSNAILDKPGKPTDDEYVVIRKHADHSLQILSRVGSFDLFADVAAAHHERLDGRGYHRGLAGDQVHFVTRILKVADMYEAMSARRPYRDAMAWEQIESILVGDIGQAVDGDCVDALCQWRETSSLAPRVDSQLRAVESLMAGPS